MRIELNRDAELDILLSEHSEKTFLLDFWSKRCEYCRYSAPAVDYVCRNNANNMILIKIEIDHFPYLAARYEINVLPTQYMISGNKSEKTVGVETTQQSISILEKMYENIRS